MKKIINYEKDILFKTNIGEICSISLEHDFTLDSGFLRGDFILSGEYKANEICLNKEPFEFRLPLEYELEPNVDVDTLTYDIDNFEYTTNQDVLGVVIDFGIRYEEKKNDPIMPSIDESDLNKDIPEEIELDSFMQDSDERVIKEEPVVELVDDKKEIKDERLDDGEKEIILESTLDKDEFITYHVHIVREGDTLETIASEYGCTIDLIKEYNNIESLELKAKLIIPETLDE